MEQTAYSPERPPPSLAHASGRCAHAGAPPRPGVRSPRSHAHRCGLPAPRATLVDGAHAWGRAGLAPRRRGGTRTAEPWEDTRPTPPCLAPMLGDRAGGLPRRWAALP